MAASKKSRHYARRSTKKRPALKPPAHPGRIVAIVLATVAVVVLALVWGSHLKAKSDAYHAAEEAGEWVLDAETATPSPTTVPALRAVEIIPEGNVGDILIAGQHGGVILPLSPEGGVLPYQSSVGDTAGLTVSPDAPSLADDVARVSRRGLRVVGVFTVTCFDESDTAAMTYRRGLELALLYEYAAAGVDELLLLGLPAGDDAHDRLAVEFLTDLRTLLNEIPSRPAVGAAILPYALTTGDVGADGKLLYAGNPSAGRLGKVCDYVALDLRDVSSVEMEELLPSLQYAYVRHSMRLLTNRDAPEVTEDVLSHGFERVLELRVVDHTRTDDESN